MRLEELVDEIEAQLQQRTSREVSSREIGELVLLQLQSISEVAYIRFASVYRQFQGIRDFVDTLNHLQNQQISDGEPEKIDKALTGVCPPSGDSIGWETSASGFTPLN